MTQVDCQNTRTRVIYSMTGFASGETETGQGTLLWEVRSVNHRYLEPHFKLPDGFRGIEAALRDQIGSALKRGKIDASLQFRPSRQASAELNLNTDLAAAVVRQAETLAQSMQSPQPLSAIEVMRWPGVVREDAIDVSALFAPARELLDETLATLVANRAREGERIRAALDSRLTDIAALAAGVRASMPTILDGIRSRVRERAESLETRIDPERLEQELVLLAQKMDVAEELDRLDAHIEEARSAFTMGGAVGRRLDFLMQEFNREANTLGSKSADPTTTKAAVDLKVLIEQMREQVQNIE